MTYNNPWHYDCDIFDSEHLEKYNDIVGFVYLIECSDTGRKYVGKKNFYSKKIVQKNLKKKKVKCESDWKKYYGSCEELHEDMAKHPEHTFTRSILHLCKSKGEMNYIEMKEQILRDVLLKDEYYNSFVGGKIHRRHLRTLRES
jgi:hypothetical protein